MVVDELGPDGLPVMVRADPVREVLGDVPLPVDETWIAGARRASGAACALLGRRRRPQMAAACCPEVYLAWATDVRLRGNGCAGSSFESHHNWLWATGRFAAF